jgi:RNA polymerase sigma factor (sigma-70 family)
LNKDFKVVHSPNPIAFKNLHMKNILRRDFLKGLVTLPFLGYFTFAFKGNILKEQSKNKSNYLKELGIERIEALGLKIPASGARDSKAIRIGLVGHGWRGPDLLRAIGYAHPEWINKNTNNGKYNEEIISFLNQEDLNIEFAGICDTFSPRAQKGIVTSTNEIWKNKLNLSIPLSVRAYLIVSLQRKITRQIKKMRSLKNEMQGLPTEFVHSKEDQLIDEQFTLDQKYMINRAVNSLTKRQKEIIQLRFYSNLSYEEIAQTMKISTDSIYNLVSKAIDNMQEEITKQAEPKLY